MPRPTIDLCEYKDELIEKFEQGGNVAELQGILHAKGVRVSQRTLQTRLKEWGHQRYERTSHKVEERRELHAMVACLVYILGFSDHAILRAIKDSGRSISIHGVVRLRKEVGVYRRFYGTAEQLLASNARLREALEEQIQTGRIDSLGKGALRDWMREHCNMHVARNRLWKEYRALRPELPNDRFKIYYERAPYTPQGPNYRWHMDGHDKLKAYGIQIYAAVDAYSRYIIWTYVGISNRTNISVLAQYARQCAAARLRPRCLRSDRGVELICTANLQYVMVNANRAPDDQVPFQHCHEWGTSKENSRVEKLWEQMQAKALHPWRLYFHELALSRNYVPHKVSHRIAMLAIYMPIIRCAVADFVMLYNGHSVRKQPNRPWSVSGNVAELYFFPPEGVQDYGEQPEWEVLNPLLENLKDVDLDEYLPRPTFDWCCATLSDAGMPQEFHGAEVDEMSPTGARLHIRAYHELRDAITSHMASGRAPRLDVCGGLRLPPALTPPDEYRLREWLGTSFDDHTDGAEILLNRLDSLASQA